MTKTLELELCEKVRDMASIVARYLGNYRLINKNSCGYEAFFENKDFMIEDRCSGNYECKAGSETKILYKGKEVYHKKAGELETYLPGKWEEDLKILDKKIRKYSIAINMPAK